MLFVEDLHPTDGNAQSTGCAMLGAGCGNTRDEALGIVDLTWEGLTTSGHVQNMARTMAHEFGHLVSTILCLRFNFKKSVSTLDLVTICFFLTLFNYLNLETITKLSQKQMK